MNNIVEISKKYNRDYITPEDVAEALKACKDSSEIDKVRLDVLEVLGNTAGVGVEDRSLCAFVAWEGKGE